MAAEIEILVRLHDDREAAHEKLSKRYTFQKRQTTYDEYLTHPGIPVLQLTSSLTLRGALRIRSTQGGVTLTAKQDIFDEHGTWSHSDEYELTVIDGEPSRGFFGILGFSELIKVQIEKTVFVGHGFEVVLEDVTDLGLFLEIEEKGHPDLSPAIRKAMVLAELNSLALNYSRDFDGGKPELLLRKRAGLDR